MSWRIWTNIFNMLAKPFLYPLSHSNTHKHTAAVNIEHVEIFFAPIKLAKSFSLIIIWSLDINQVWRIMTVNILISTHINFVIDLNRKAIFNRFVCMCARFCVFVVVCMNGMIPKIWSNFRSNDVALGHFSGKLEVCLWYIRLYYTLKFWVICTLFCASHSFIIPFYQINVQKCLAREKKLDENIFAQITNKWNIWSMGKTSVEDMNAP